MGDVEEWTVRNVTGEHHVFHVHQTDFLVTSTNGSRSDMLRVLDTINVPFASNGTPGQVTLICRCSAIASPEGSCITVIFSNTRMAA